MQRVHPHRQCADQVRQGHSEVPLVVVTRPIHQALRERVAAEDPLQLPPGQTLNLGPVSQVRGGREGGRDGELDICVAVEELIRPNGESPQTVVGAQRRARLKHLRQAPAQPVWGNRAGDGGGGPELPPGEGEAALYGRNGAAPIRPSMSPRRHTPLGTAWYGSVTTEPRR